MSRLIKGFDVIRLSQGARFHPTSAAGLRHPRQCRGDFIIEALIGVLLMGLVSVGITQVLGKMHDTQRDFVLQQSASHQLRNQLMQGQNLCALNTIDRYDAENLAVTIKAGCAAAVRETVEATITIGNATVPAARVAVNKPVNLAVSLDQGEPLQVGVSP
jgi:hypothetical protein